jgi:GMP synthase (glutamine-hydrolysing)
LQELPCPGDLRTVRPLVCLRHESLDTLGSATRAFAEEALEVVVLDTWQGSVSYPALDEVSGLVVLGGQMNVDQTARFPFLAPERSLLVEAVECGLPVLGICLGAQMMARAFGAEVVPARAREIGFLPLDLTEAGRKDPVLSGLAPGGRVFQWHEDSLGLPSDAMLLATGSNGLVQAFRLGDRAWAIQFHLEMDRAEFEGWLGATGVDLKDRWGKSAGELRREAEMHLEEQQQRARGVFRRFAAEVRRSGAHPRHRAMGRDQVERGVPE